MIKRCAMAILAALAVAGCGSDDATQCTGTTCVCPADKTCSPECDSTMPGCDVMCQSGSSCDVTCEAMGDCDVSCGAADSCDVDCNSGTCDVECPMSGCTVTNCLGEGCEVHCFEGATPIHDNTTVTCPG